MQQNIDNWPVLIICPSSVRDMPTEFMNWLHVKEEDIRIILKGSQELDGKINIISFDLAIKVIENHHKFNFVIIDESHFIKNRNAKRTVIVGHIAKK